MKNEEEGRREKRMSEAWRVRSYERRIMGGKSKE
jgi:hypothetical protein